MKTRTRAQQRDADQGGIPVTMLHIAKLIASLKKMLPHISSLLKRLMYNLGQEGEGEEGVEDK